jgi:hypothetical protein
MDSTMTLTEIDERIALVRDNLRDLVEQATAFSGSGDETRTQDRIADQEAALAKLLAARADVTKSRSG